MMKYIIMKGLKKTTLMYTKNSGFKRENLSSHCSFKFAHQYIVLNVIKCLATSKRTRG